MPVLRKHKEKESHYISGKLPGSNQFCTWQVSNEGVKFLQQERIGEDQVFPAILLQTMRDKGYLSTAGSGFSDTISISTIGEEENDHTRAQLIVHLSNTAWSLAVKFPELSQDTIAKLNSREWQSFLLSCHIVVDNHDPLSARLFSSGKGGADSKVVPHAHPYTWKLVGSWPEHLGVSSWGTSLPGLRKDGELFRQTDTGARRILAGGAVAPGDDLIFIAHRSAAHRPLYGVPAETLAVADEWAAWSISLPAETLNSPTETWIEQLGYRISLPAWNVRLVAPALRLYGSDLPYVRSQSTVLLSITPPSEQRGKNDDVTVTAHRDAVPITNVPITKLFAQPALKAAHQAWTEAEAAPSSARYIRLVGCEKGLYRIGAVAGNVRPFFFRVVDDIENMWAEDTIRPLSLDIHLSGLTYELHAFSGSDEATVIRVGTNSALENLQISAHCAAPFAVSWISSAAPVRYENVTPESVTGLLRSLLMRVLTPSNPVTILFDAQDFGSIRLGFSLPAPTREVVDNRGEIPAATLQKLYWLRTMLAHYQNHSSELVAIPTVFHQTMRSLADNTIRRELLHMQRCPAWLLPHLVQITQELRSVGQLNHSSHHSAKE